MRRRRSSGLCENKPQVWRKTHQPMRHRTPKTKLGKEAIGSQIAFLPDERKDGGDNFDGVLGVRGPQFWKIACDFEQRRTVARRLIQKNDSFPSNARTCDSLGVARRVVDSGR